MTDAHSAVVTLITGDKKISRPGGRLIMFGEKIIRYAQMDGPTYGSTLRAFEIDELTATNYRKHELPQSPILRASGKGWNAAGMHHIDPHHIKDNEWIACVDGKTKVKVFDGKTGVDTDVTKTEKTRQRNKHMKKIPTHFFMIV